MTDPNAITRIASASLAAVRHGFLGRTGGVSTGIYAGLNVGLGSADDRDAVYTNRRRAIEAVAPDCHLVTCHQIHSATAVVAERWADDARPEADALVTDAPGLALGILTADCAPVLLADPAAGVIGAAHAGWRGAVGGVLDAVVVAMVGLGAERSRIRAAIGPAIALRSYEVGPEFRERLLADHPNNARYFREGPRGRPHFDLESYCAARLAAVGVSEVEALGIDTCTRPQYFYSYRRATLAGEPDYGRQLSLIALPSGR